MDISKDSLSRSKEPVNESTVKYTKNCRPDFSTVPMDFLLRSCYLKPKILTLSVQLRERCEYGCFAAGYFRGLLLPYPLGYGIFYFGRTLWKRESRS